MIKRLRADPTDEPALHALLDYVDRKYVAYYVPGELYRVPTTDGVMTKELAEIQPGCRVACMANGCPGKLRFRDGAEICPFDWKVSKAIATDPYVVPLKLIQRLLYRGISRGSVELYDGRKVTFNISKKRT